MSGDVVSQTAARHTADPRIPQRRAADPTASVWVAASAGTGKTKVLSDRVLSLMLAGTEPRKILCLTFTRAAAAEMATRIAQTLGTWATKELADLEETLTDLLGHPPGLNELRLARRLFADVIDAPGGMNIQTIHAFCQSLLGRFPLEAGVAPHFTVMDERDAQEMLTAAREDVLAQARLSDISDLAHGLNAVTAHVHEQTFSDLMDELAVRRGALRRLMARFGDSVEQAARNIRKQLGLEEGETVEGIVADACADNAFDGLLIRSAATALEQGGKIDANRAPVVAAWLESAAPDRQTQFNAYAACFLVEDKNKRALRKVRSRQITKSGVATMAEADTVLEAEAERLLKVVQKRRAAVSAEATSGLLRLGGAMLEAYEEQKRRRALLDYDDLIGLTRDLLARPDVASWVLYKLDGGIDHVLIDEAQDTNPDQWDVIAHLTGEFFAGAGARTDTRTVFAVGDVKQSIFSFQGADPAAFQDMRDHFDTAVHAAGQPWRQEALTVSFRSTRAVLAAVDRVFTASPARDGVTLDGAEINHVAFRHGDGGLVEIWAPTEAAKNDPPPPWKPPVEAVSGDSPRVRLANALARRIQRMTAGNEFLESKGRPIHAGDILVLVRTRGAFVEDLVRALKQIGVEVAGVDRMVLSDQLAVMDLVALGNFLLLPEDDLTLATILKSPLIGLSEEHLFTLAYDRQGTLWQSLTEQADVNPAFATAQTYLADLLARADFVPPYELFAHVLGPLGGRQKLMARLGFEAEDPITEFMDLALSFERHHTASLQGFLHWLEVGAVEIKRDLEHSARDAVRVMTAHGAKGLQAPVIFLPDTMRVPRVSNGILWPRGDDGESFLLWPPRSGWRDEVADQEFERLKTHRDEEYRRLLYV
ncbi:MAG: double-strand break repair helicase AddA, partial [Rhodospirillales bacterium]